MSFCGCASSPTFLQSSQSGPQGLALRYSRHELPAGTTPHSLVTADFNGDGIADLAFANDSDRISDPDGTVSILLGNGDGTFRPKIEYQVGIAPEQIVVADFNNDGFLDLAVSNRASDSISILLGNGDGTFRPGGEIKHLGGTAGLATADFNRDGRPDLAITARISLLSTIDSVSVYLNNGTGSFNPRELPSGGSIPVALASGDFNGDGLPDLAVVNQHSGTVSIFLSNADGSFRQSAVLETGITPGGIIVADFNADGHADLVVANIGQGSVSVFLGNGDGTFADQADYRVGSFPGNPVAVDLDLDGHVDLLVGTLNRVAVLLGTGDGTVRPAIYLETVPHDDDVSGIVSADFNQDGIPDIAALNSETGSLTLFLSKGNVQPRGLDKL